MNATVTVRLNKPYMNFPKGARVRLTRDKADLLVKRKTAKIEGQEVTYTELEMNNIIIAKEKEINKLSEAYEEASSKSIIFSATLNELKNILEEEKRKVAFLENKLKRYITKPTEKKNLDAPPQNKMMTDRKTVNKRGRSKTNNSKQR